jgi:hypothetical protein
MNRGGVLERSPSWVSSDMASSGTGRFGDLDGDGDPDWAVNNGDAGAVYENGDTLLGLSPVWSSNPQGGMGIDIADMDGDGLEPIADTFVVGGSRLFYLSAGPVQSWSGVSVNGAPLAESLYCWSPMRGWVSVGLQLSPGDTLICEYERSSDLELLLSDYPGDRAHLFLNSPTAVSEPPAPNAPRVLMRVWPNPFTASVAVTGVAGDRLAVIDVTGRTVRSLQASAGEVTWDGRDESGEPVRPGVYLGAAGDGRSMVRMVRAE